MSASVYCSLNAVQPSPRSTNESRTPALLSILRQSAVEPGALRSGSDVPTEARATESESS